MGRANGYEADLAVRPDGVTYLVIGWGQTSVYFARYTPEARGLRRIARLPLEAKLERENLTAPRSQSREVLPLSLVTARRSYQYRSEMIPLPFPLSLTKSVQASLILGRY